MRDYEILIVVFTVMAIIVSLIIEYKKKQPSSTKDTATKLATLR